MMYLIDEQQVNGSEEEYVVFPRSSESVPFLWSGDYDGAFRNEPHAIR